MVQSDYMNDIKNFLESHGIKTKIVDGVLFSLDEWVNVNTKERGATWVIAPKTMTKARAFMGY